MSTLVVGDFRAAQLAQYQKNLDSSIDWAYLVENSAEYSWFESTAVPQIILNAPELTSVVLMLGFNDCLYSSAWSCFNLNNTVTSYVNKIKELADSCPDISFYICSVNPVESNFTFSEHYRGLIYASDINNTIKEKQLQRNLNGPSYRYYSV